MAIFRPHESKYCWVADILTLFRFVTALLILVMAFSGWGQVATAILIFGLGELSDALDGPWARTFLHPRWSRELWFRKYASELDQLTDILLGFSILVFVTVRVDFIFGMGILVLAVLIALPIELSKDAIEERLGKDTRRAIVMTRRGLYVYAIFLVLGRLFEATPYYGMVPPEVWWNIVKYTIPVMGIALIAILKPDRATQEKTPTPAPSVPDSGRIRRKPIPNPNRGREPRYRM